ncbi:MAG: hypothetical protein LR015_14655 [Verrucomicrobia bacterium]|nr:hypothetical protein [Verrucomicrobiota bacterium]
MSKTTPQHRPQKQARTIIWFGLGEKSLTERGTVRTRLLWGRISILLIVLFSGAWMAKSVGLYFFFKNVRNFEDVTFVSMLGYPFNRGEVRRNQGDYQVDQAFIAVEEGDFRRAMSLAQQGVARSPGNQRGRMLLIDIYAGWQPQLALQLLESGFQYFEGDIDYLRRYAQMLLFMREDEQLLDLAARVLPSEPVINDYNKLLAMAAMRAAVNIGDYERAHLLFNAYKLDDTAEGVILAADLLSRLGRRSEGITLLEQFAMRFQTSDIDSVLASLASHYREQGMFQQAVDIGLTRSLRRPLDWQPRLDLLVTYQKMEAKDRITRELESLSNQFRRDERAMTAIGQMATDLGDVEAARRIYEIALENNFSTAVFGLLFIEAHITSHRFAEAIAFFDELTRENPTWIREFEAVFNSMRALAYHGIGNRELGDFYVRETLQSRRINPITMLSVGQRFVRMGMPEQGRLLMMEAFRREPANEQLLARIIEVNLDLGESRTMTDDVETLLGLRRTSYDLLRRLLTELGSDRFIFTEQREQLVDRLQNVLSTETSIELEFRLRPVPSSI